MLGLLREATGLSLEIAECNVHTGLEDAYFQVKTVSGGEGIGTARRGITASEARLASHCVGKRPFGSQAIAVDCFRRNLRSGRYGSTCCLANAIVMQRWTAL